MWGAPARCPANATGSSRSPDDRLLPPEACRGVRITTTYTYDCEFIEDGRTIELISIGIVSETGREYYAVNADMPVKRIRKHKWLMDNVVPSLPKAHDDRQLTMPKHWLFDKASPLVKKRSRIATEVRAFLLAEDTPELWADWGAYDHIVLAQLWGSMTGRPEGIPMFTHDIEQAIESVPGFVKPEQVKGQHNALEDARHNMRVLTALRAAKES